MAKVRLGIIGVGKMGRTHIDGMADVEDAEVVAITDPARFPETGPNLAAEYGLDYEEDIDALVGRTDVDAVVVTTPHTMHAEHTVPVLEAGKHALVEKPLDTTLDKCDRIIKAAADAGVKLMVAQSHRYWDGDAIAKQLLEEGAIGRLLLCRDVLAGAGHRRPADDPEAAWRTDPELYGPGGLIGWGVHDVDRLRWWFESEADTVMGRSFPLRTDVEGDTTTNMMMINFQNGGCAHFWYSEALPPPGWKGFSCSAQLVGEEGLMDVNPYGQVRVARAGSGEWETVYDHSTIDDPRQKAFSGEDRDFIKCIVEDTTPAVTGEDGRAAVEICLAAYRSSEIGTAVKLPLEA